MHLELHKCRKPISVSTAPSSDAHLPSKTPIRNNDTNHILARLQIIRNIIRLIFSEVIKRTPARHQRRASNVVPVDKKLVPSTSRCVSSSTDWVAREVQDAGEVYDSVVFR